MLLVKKDVIFLTVSAEKRQGPPSPLPFFCYIHIRNQSLAKGSSSG